MPKTEKNGGSSETLMAAGPARTAERTQIGEHLHGRRSYACVNATESLTATKETHVPGHTWPVPVAGMLWCAYGVVAIDCAAALAAEALAMKNCLATYEEACRSGDVAVYSIRERSEGTRIACFAAERVADNDWQLIEVAGKMNATVDDELERIGHAMVVKLNGGRGGEVVPF